MANSLPFNAVAVDGEYDRVYKAEDWAWYFATFIANGIFPKPSDGLQVVAYSGMEIRVNAGYAFINGYAFRNPATLSVTLDTAEGALNRVDRVVVRWDLPQRDMYIAVLKGTPSAKPTATAVTRTTEIWELALADIYVGKGVTRIQTQNITDQRFNSAVCGIVTGTVEEIDASVLTKQFTDFFNTYSAAVLDEFSAYKQSMEKYLTEIAGVYDSYVSKTEGLFAQYESQFNERYSSFESTLDNWDKELLSAYTEFMAKIKLFQSDAENEFNTWFESIKDKLGEEFPQDPKMQLMGAIKAVFRSWDNPRAIYYRRMNDIPSDWGTAVNVQSMVFGNTGDTSGTGVAFTRNPATGEKKLFGEFLMNAQGEDVVAGVRTPQTIDQLAEVMPEAYKQFTDICAKLEYHYRDMQDMEFTVQEGKLWFLQTRNGKRTGTAMVKIAMDLLHEGMIDEKTAILRCEPQKLDELLHPVFDKLALSKAKVITQGLPASPGAACGQIVFHADDAEEWHDDGKKVIMVRIETSPEDLAGMSAAEGILTARGGMTSHAAVVARGMGKCCVSGAGSINVDYKTKTVEIEGVVYKEGDYISLNGTTGQVYAGQIETKAAELSGDFKELMDLCDKYTKMEIRTNADTPHDAKVARQFGAKGIGLTRTEHMFFDDQKIVAMREMILADSVEGREKALAKLLPYQKADFYGILKAMDGCHVNIRLLDPPLHEFVPHDKAGQETMANEMGVSVSEIKKRVNSLAENNPMLGHRGCRLGITFPEITAMQTRAILGAACQLKKEGFNPRPEIMVPLIGTVQELKQQKSIILATAKEVFAEYGVEVEFEVGTMIEIPRAALTAAKIAEEAQYFSFGTNDLTQMTFGYSRDDIASFLPAYMEKKILKVDPFQVLDQEGVGQLIKMAVENGRATRPNLRTGICGEHGGEPSSVKFCAKVGMNYASCSPFRVPIARLAAAQGAIEQD